MESRVLINRRAISLHTMLLSLACVYLVINFGFTRIGNRILTTYVGLPAIWLMLFIITSRFLPSSSVRVPGRVRDNMFVLALTGGLSQVVLYFALGIVTRFGQSPHTFTLVAIARNLLLVGATLVGMEFSRAWLVRRFGKKHLWLAVAGVAAAYAFISVSFNAFSRLRLETSSIEYLNRTLLPLLAENLFASQMAFFGGPIVSLSYRGILQAFWWFSPILPDPGWPLLSLTGIAVPVIMMVVANSLWRSLIHCRRDSRQVSGWAAFTWLGTAVVGVVIIWFAVGLLPLKPALVGSGSMTPSLQVGDVAVVAGVPVDRLQVGDIIWFRKDGDAILHRIVEIRVIDDGRTYITRGDANEEADLEPVYDREIVGRYIFALPRVGWLGIIVKSFFSG